MRYAIMIPAEASEDIPQGAAVIRHGRDALLVYSGPRVPFGERCARAIRNGRLVRAGADVAVAAEEIGWFDDYEGEARLSRKGRTVLDRWLGHPVRRNDLAAWDNQADRRQRARRLTFQGRTAEAYLIDRRLGL